MRTTKHGGPRPWRRHGRTAGIPLALAVVGLLACLAVALFPAGGAGAAGTANTSAAGVTPSAPAGSESPVAAAATTPAAPATTASAPPSATSPSPAPSGTTPAPTASGSPRAAAAAAGRIKPGVGYQGVATAYEAGDGNGACLYGPSADLMVAAMNHTDYESARACGAYVLVRAANGASITVRIVNECPLPCAPGQLDLSRQAFAELADLKVGRLPITWTLVSPAAVDTLSVRYKTGSSRYWCGIQVIGHRNPVASLEVRTASGWRQLPRTDYNYFLAADGNGCGGSIRVTDIYGQQLTVDGIAIEPDVAQPTRVQFARH